MQCISSHVPTLQAASSSTGLRRWIPFSSRPATPRCFRVRSTDDATTTTAETPKADVDLDRQIKRFTKTTAATFAPRSSTAQKNPAVKGSTLYWIFEYQAWIAMAAGALLSYNIIFPTDGPSIPRLLGMWSIWMFTIPSLRAKECMPKEREALNLLFVAVPLMNVTLPLLWKSFPFIFTSDVIVMLFVYYYYGVWKEVYGLPIEPPLK